MGLGRRGAGRNGRPTLEQVAARAGVGRGTVSRVINGSPRVSDRTRTVVQQAIADLGYVPHRAARALAANRADAIALVVPETEGRLFNDPYFSVIIRGISAVLADADMQLLLTLIRSPKERQRFAEYAAGNRVDGVLLVSLHGEDPLPEQLTEYGIPGVMNGRRSAAESFPHVDVDNVGGAQLAVEHLIGRGRQTVATITGPLDMYGARSRLDGYREGLRAAGRPDDEDLVHYGDYSEESGYEGMRGLLRRRPDLDAVFCASDLMAAGARQALREAGRSVPDDVALVGFDDSAIARHMDPPLTSVRQPIEEMGRAMALALLAEINDPGSGPARQVLPTELMRRASS
ncbi:LacI family DNA-binding transcriptional regulator [Streptomyces sp. YIM 98790]|uniref:LacI family DNA-binding transcriptional regulator n=1 Tax=Streptomyces sp. YIM 98790 TaxID=2689077 RepID=UPI00140C6D04|nr:LacI family DNA-binding transcriptional regulator [Streptomyces sp. YIM 98790]